MLDSPRTVLKRLAKTALLASGLGLVLYGALMGIAELAYGRWVITLVLAVPATLLLAFMVFDALRTGVFPVWRHAVSRRSEPGRYWMNIGWHAACALLLGAIALWSGTELATASLSR
nr:hypothetical protein [uncultured Roseococcus sp.]